MSTDTPGPRSPRGPRRSRLHAGRAGRPTSTNRVVAFSASWMPVTSGSSPYVAAANSPANAPSYRPSCTSLAPSAFEAADSHCASGRFRSSHLRTCGCATGCPVTVLTASSRVPGRTSSANAIGSSTSR